MNCDHCSGPGTDLSDCRVKRAVETIHIEPARHTPGLWSVVRRRRGLEVEGTRTRPCTRPTALRWARLATEQSGLRVVYGAPPPRARAAP